MTDVGLPVEGRRIEQVPINDLRPHPRNMRRHKMPQLLDSLRRWGFTQPVLIDERTGLIAAGHGRWQAVATLKKAGEAPPDGITVDEHDTWLIPVVRGWESRDDAEALALLIADNRHAETGGWDFPALAEVLTDMKAVDLGLSGVGFTPRDLDEMLAPPGTRKQVDVENSYDQRADNYRNKQLRTIVFDFPLADYERVMTWTATARPRYEVETNSELFLAMLRRYDEEHPAP